MNGTVTPSVVVVVAMSSRAAGSQGHTAETGRPVSLEVVPGIPPLSVLAPLGR